MDDLDNVFTPVEAPIQEADAPPVENVEANAEPAVTAQDTPQQIEQPQHVERSPVVEEQHVPLVKFLDTRDELKEAKRRLAEYEAQRQQASAPAIPDAYDDPDGFTKAVLQAAEQRRIADRFEDDAEDCKEKFGEDKLNAATEWAQTKAQSDPSFAASYMRQRKPITWIVKQHQQSADIDDYSKDPVAFAKRILEQHQQPIADPAPAAPAAIPQQAAPPVKVPRSLASQGSAPSDLRHTATGALAGVDALFN